MKKYLSAKNLMIAGVIATAVGTGTLYKKGVFDTLIAERKTEKVDNDSDPNIYAGASAGGSPKVPDVIVKSDESKGVTDNKIQLQESSDANASTNKSVSLNKEKSLGDKFEFEVKKDIARIYDSKVRTKYSQEYRIPQINKIYGHIAELYKKKPISNRGRRQGIKKDFGRAIETRTFDLYLQQTYICNTGIVDNYDGSVKTNCEAMETNYGYLSEYDAFDKTSSTKLDFALAEVFRVGIESFEKHKAELPF